MPRAASPSPARARSAWSELLLALAGRFGPVEREPRFAGLRPKLAQAALVPSRVFDDAAVWTKSEGSTREVRFWGEPTAGGAYRIGVVENARAPGRPGEYGGRLELERLAPSEFRWHVQEALAIGSISGEELQRSADALLRLAESATPGDARPAVRESLPRSAAALGRLFSLERVDLAAAPDGGRGVDLEAALHPEWLPAHMASYGGFLRRYVAAVAMVVSIEEGGAPYVEVSLRGGRLALRANIEHAALVPRQGPPRPLPDRCQVRFSFTMKQGLFRVGFERLSGELALLRVPPLGFDVRFRTEPDWQLPFLVAPFLSGPLRRPFEGEGVTLSYRLEDSAPGAGSATATRDYRLAVKENWIVRWLAGNVGGTVVDFRRGAEPEADRFASEALLALHDDVLALLADARPQ